MEVSIYSTIVFIVVTIELSLATVVFLGNKQRSARMLTGLIIVHTIWVIIESVFHSTSSPDIANYAILITHFVGGLLASLFYLFSLTYPRDLLPKTRDFLIVVAIQALLIFAYAHDMIIGEVYTVDDPQRWAWNWGELFYLFHLSFLGFWMAGLYNLFRSTVSAHEPERRNLSFTLSAMILTVLPISVITVLLPLFGIYQYAWVGSITSLLWISTLAYSLLLYYKMNMRASLAQILVLAAGIILFVNIFVSDSEAGLLFIPSNVVFRVIIFVAFFVFVVGYLLIVSILRQSEQKEKIESLNTELGQLNTELEEKVTDRTKALNNSKRHIEVILENLTIGIVEYSSDFKLLQINKVAEQMLGVAREHTLQKQIQPAAEGDTASLSKIMFDWQSEENEDDPHGGVTYNEIRIEHPVHRELQVVTIPIRIIPFTKITGFVKLLRDVTYERAVDRGKSDFIAIVAHQLSASLEATGWAISEILKEGVTDKQHELLTKTRTSNDNLTQIVSDLLVAARIDGDEYTPKMQKENIVDLVDAELKGLEEKTAKKHIKIVFNKDNSKVPAFYYDREKIAMALRNILSNAIDYTPEGGNITVTSQHTNDGFVMLRVKDTGIGIPKEELDRIFTKFYRSKEALLMETDRSGLGLYITKHIVDVHEGYIDIDSEEGSGTVVTIYLPLVTEERGHKSTQSLIS